MPRVPSPPVEATVRRLLHQAAEMMRVIPHRDVTTGLYIDWMKYYVTALQHFSGFLPSLSSSSRAGATETMTAAMNKVRQEMDAMLLSSVCSFHWRDVYLPTPAPTGKPLPPSSEWWFSPTADWRSIPPAVARVELGSPEFFSEPLLGGNFLSSYIHHLQQIRSNRPSSATEVENASHTRLVVPFTTLWLLKMEAVGRSEAASASSGAGQPLVLSLHERHARQSVVQALQFAFQLGSSVTREAMSESTPPAASIPPLLHVMKPSEEFDAVCHLPSVRDRLEAGEATGAPLTLESICSSHFTRLSYLTQCCQLLKSTCDETASPSSKRRVVLLAPSHCRAYRCSGNLLALEKTSISFSTSASLSEASSSHRAAVKGCKDAARYLNSREENLRQSLSLK